MYDLIFFFLQCTEGYEYDVEKQSCKGNLASVLTN